NGGQVVVQSSTLSANQAEASGAIANRFSAGVVTVTNSTITGNFSIFAGGMINTFGTLTVTNSTITGNSSQFSGGGIVNSGGTVTVTNTIVAGNAGGDVTGAYTGSHNLIGGTPLLGTLGSYGGPTPTIPLLPGSPAIDAGDDAVCAQTGTGKVNGVDQRGITRPQGAHCDIGAFEALPPPNPLPPAKPPGPAAGAPSPLPGSRPAGMTGGPAPNPLPVARP
ncbi:MAG TPA: choice-of-anchor Q domain-containing protein, partial [Thermomicrobiales bacterium]